MASAFRRHAASFYRARIADRDVASNLYYFTGFREFHYRRMAVASLRLRPGDTVVDFGCDTGINFAPLRVAVGPQGRIIGVDPSAESLTTAAERITEQGWKNVELVQARLPEWSTDARVDALLSTFAMSLSQPCDKGALRAASCLAPGGRITVLDLQPPRAPWDRLMPLASVLLEPLGLDGRYFSRRPWHTIQRRLLSLLGNLQVQEFYGGVVWMACAERDA